MDHKWIINYENSKQLRFPNENWQSNKYDFSDPHVRLEYVPEMGCSVGGCISALKKLWKNYKIDGRNGEPRGDYAYLIRNLQGALGLQKSQFPELPEEVDDDNEDQGLTAEELQAQREEQQENGGEWDLNFNYGNNELYTGEWSDLDKTLLREEKAEGDDW